LTRMTGAGEGAGSGEEDRGRWRRIFRKKNPRIPTDLSWKAEEANYRKERKGKGTLHSGVRRKGARGKQNTKIEQSTEEPKVKKEGAGITIPELIAEGVQQETCAIRSGAGK